MTRRELKVGDRVRVYSETGLFTGIVDYIFNDRAPSIRVRHGDGIREMTRDVFREQCRRLKPRAPKEPKPERDSLWAKVSVEVFDKRKGDAIGYDRQFNFFFSNSGELLQKLIKPLEGNGPLACLRPGEVRVDRAKLAEAYRATVLDGCTAESCFLDFCRALGLEAP